ncbi:hypothetical protein JCM17823_21580 [Halorubrum gandharaense]
MPKREHLSRRRFLTASGGVATAAAVAGCSSQEPDDEDDNGENGDDEPSGPDLGEHNVDKAQEAWERVQANPGPEAEDVRNQAYVEIEEAVRDDMVLLPLYHGLTERFSYEWVELDSMGALGLHHQTYNDVEIDTDHDQKDENVLSLINSTISTLDPIASTDTASATLLSQLYEGLTTYPAGVAEVENQLLEEVEISEDSETYTFHINEDAEFHDGTDLTAGDFKYAWRRLAESPSSQRASFLLDAGTGVGITYETDEDEGVGPRNVVPDSEGIEVIDDHTFEIELQSPNPAVLEIVTYDSFAAVPEGYVDDLPDYDGEISQEDFATEDPNGTGPFEFDEWVPDSEARVERFDAFHGSQANVEAVEWNVIEDADAIWTVITERNVDAFEIPTAFYDRELVDAETDDRQRDIGEYGPIENGDMLNYVGVPDIATYYFGFNVAQTDRAARKAFAHLMDHEELVQEVFEGRGTEAFSFTPPAIWPEETMPYDDWVDQWPYGVNETQREEAREIMEGSGYDDDDPYELTLTTYQDPTFQDAGRLVRDKAAGIGLDIDLEEAQFNTLQSRGEDGDLQAYSLGWVWSWTDIAYGMFGFEPANTDTDLLPEEADGYYLDWEAARDE